MATSLLDELMDEVKCRSCLCRIEFPLMKCTAGHHFCGECNKSPTTCPLCKIPTERDYLIERLCLTNIKCPFVKTGCEFTGKPSEVAVHRSSCSGSSSLDNNITSEAIGDSKDEVSKKQYIDNDPAKSLDEAIIAELQCPVCLMQLSPPMMECRNSHLICIECLPQMERCPVCRDSRGFSVNRFLGYIFYLLKFPCRNVNNGCKKRGNGSYMRIHEKLCKYVIISCPLTTSHKCTWVGLELQVLNHCRSAHFEVLNLEPACEKASRTNPPFDLQYKKGVLFRFGWVEIGEEHMFIINHFGNKSSEEYLVSLRLYSNFWKHGKYTLRIASFRLNTGDPIDKYQVYYVAFPKKYVDSYELVHKWFSIK